jgi:hypothetical protein
MTYIRTSACHLNETGCAETAMQIAERMNEFSPEARQLLAEIQADPDRSVIGDLNPDPGIKELLEAGKIKNVGSMIIDNWGTGSSSHTAMYKLEE